MIWCYLAAILVVVGMVWFLMSLHKTSKAPETSEMVSLTEIAFPLLVPEVTFDTGKEGLPVYMSSSGRFFTERTSKNNKTYRAYIDGEAEEACRVKVLKAYPQLEGLFK